MTTTPDTAPAAVTMTACLDYAATVLGEDSRWSVTITDGLLDAQYAGTITTDVVEVVPWGNGEVMATRVVVSMLGTPIRDEAHAYPLTAEGFAEFQATVNGWS